MRFPRLAAAALAVSALSAAPLAAAPWVVDKSHAAVTFTVSHLGFSLTHGQFREFDAQIDFDPDNIEAASVAFTIKAASVDTNWEARDKHIRSGDFLDVENHENITFVSKSVRLIDTDTAEVTGDVTIRGETHEEVFTATLRKIGPSPFKPELTIAGFTIEGELERAKYGVKYGVPAIGATIPVRIDLEISPAG